MRTAKTHYRGEDGKLRLHAADEVPADKQRAAFHQCLLGKWPKDVIEIQWQPSDGPVRILYRDKAKAQAKQIADAEQRAAAKLELGTRLQAEAINAAKAEAEARKSADEKERAAAIKAKEASKAHTK